MITILAFALLFWHAEQPTRWLIVGEHDVFFTLLIVIIQPPLLWITSTLAATRSIRLLEENDSSRQRAQLMHHRVALVLRIAALCGLAAAIKLTNWPTWFAWGRVSPVLQIFGDLIILSPFVVNLIAIWCGAHRLEQAIHEDCLTKAPPTDGNRKTWNLRSYVGFNLRHQVFVVAVPLVLILLASNLTRGYARSLQLTFNRAWAPDAVLGLSAVVVFVFAPLLICRVWRTGRLEEGELRQRLDLLCDRIGLKCRDILIWYSDGMAINAAVMGVFAPLRYVLLSDALLDTMTPPQIEAVFGHEAGHVKKRHIQHFLVFAFVGWLLVAAIMELMARWWVASPQIGGDSVWVVRVVGVAATVAFWGLGFGWVSRRFEREADTYGAQCVTPDADGCHQPCSVHPENGPERKGTHRVCTTGAAIFASALDRVAVLNGIPHEERSWRHSSIGSRIRFLTSLSGDPTRAERFHRLVHRIRRGLVAAALIGSAGSVYYWSVVERPALLALQSMGG